MPTGSADVRGAWVARRVDDRETGRDMRMVMRMRLFDRQARARERRLTLLALRGGPGRATPGDRSLMRFDAPADIRGTAFLVWEQPGADDERFLYLPSLGRVRRIAGSEAQESFVGSDFSYEDIGGRRIDDYTYTLLDADARWTAPDGSVRSVYRLQSVHKDPNARYPRVVSLVLQDSFVVAHADVYNKRGDVQKTFEARRVEKSGQYWTVMEMAMSDAAQRTRTELVVEQVAYDVGLKPEDFSRRELERP